MTSFLYNVDCDDGKRIDIQMRDIESPRDDAYWSEGIAHAGGPPSGPEKTVDEERGIGKLFLDEMNDPRSEELARPTNEWMRQQVLKDAQNREARIHLALKSIKDCAYSIQIFLHECGESEAFTIAQRKGIDKACSGIHECLRIISEISSPGRAKLDILPQVVIDKPNEHKNR